MKRNKTKWKYSNQQTIEEILQEEQAIKLSQETQQVILIRKINTAMMYYFFSECRNYHCKISKGNLKEKQFLYIDKIFKENQLIYDSENLNLPKNGKRNNELRHQRMLQCLQLSELIQNEKQLKFVFNDSVRYFEIIKIVDENENEIDLKQFLHQFEQFNKLIQLIEFNENQNRNQNNISINESIKRKI